MIDGSEMSTSTQSLAVERSEHSQRGFPETLSSAIRFRTGMGLLLALLVVSIILAAGAGAVHVPSSTIVSMLANRTGMVHVPRTWPLSDETIIFQIRLPRVLAAALVGAAL